MTNNIVLIGSSSELSDEFIKLSYRTQNLFGISREKSSDKFQDHLRVSDYESQIADIENFIEKIKDPIVIFFNGFLAENRDTYFPTDEEVKKTIEINFLIPLKITERLNKNLKIKKFVYISSMAAVVPRFKNYIYGLAKKSLEESVKKISNIEFLILRFGQINTEMSSSHNVAPFKLDKDKAANIILKKIEKKGLRYATFELRIISYLLRLVPIKFIDKLEIR